MSRGKYITEEIRMPSLLAVAVTARAARIGIPTNDFIIYAMTRYLDEQATRQDAEAIAARDVRLTTGR